MPRPAVPSVVPTVPAMPSRSNKGGAVRGRARAAQVHSLNATYQAARRKRKLRPVGTSVVV